MSSLTTLLRRGPALPSPADTGSVVARATGASAVLGGREVLTGVDLDVRAGEFLALVGPNGAGKSTLLSVLAGDVPVSGGAVELFGRPLPTWSTVEAAMRRSVLLQTVTLSFPFRVREVVEMGRAPWTGTAREDDDDTAVHAAMADTDTLDFADRRFSDLSGGERARVALARVLAQRAPIVMLDEPTAALDLHHQELVLGLARDRAGNGDAVVVVVHDLTLAAAYADRVAVLAAGRLAAVGLPADVLSADLLSDVYTHDIDVFPHPTTGEPIILPRR